jgi:hypothetical protein
LPLLTQDQVLVTNWHPFERQSVRGGARVVKRGVAQRVREWIHIGPKSTTDWGQRCLSQKDLEQQIAVGQLTLVEEERAKSGNLKCVQVESVRYVGPVLNGTGPIILAVRPCPRKRVRANSVLA